MIAAHSLPPPHSVTPAVPIVPEHWLLVLRPREDAPLLEYTSPLRIRTRVRYPWER